MITIITGEKNVGKTSYLEAWYDREKRGVGFCCRKVWHGEMCQGYDLVLFPDGGSRAFIRLKEEPAFAEEGWAFQEQGAACREKGWAPQKKALAFPGEKRAFPKERSAIREEQSSPFGERPSYQEERRWPGSSSRFHFDPAAFLLAEKWIRSHPWNRTAPVWMDEIGLLEVGGKGFDALFRRVLAERREIRVVFRKQVLKDLVARYGLRGYRLIVL